MNPDPNDYDDHNEYLRDKDMDDSDTEERNNWDNEIFGDDDDAHGEDMDTKSSISDTTSHSHMRPLRPLTRNSSHGSLSSLASIAATVASSYAARPPSIASSDHDDATAASRGTLIVKLIGIMHLRPYTQNGDLTPYCSFRIGPHVMQSRAVEKSLSPYWGEDEIFEVTGLTLSSTPSIEISLFDKQSNVRLAYPIEIPLQSCQESEGIPCSIWAPISLTLPIFYDPHPPARIRLELTWRSEGYEE